MGSSRQSRHAPSGEGDPRDIIGAPPLLAASCRSILWPPAKRVPDVDVGPAQVAAGRQSSLEDHRRRARVGEGNPSGSTRAGRFDRSASTCTYGLRGSTKTRSSCSNQAPNPGHITLSGIQHLLAAQEHPDAARHQLDMVDRARSSPDSRELRGSFGAGKACSVLGIRVQTSRSIPVAMTANCTANGSGRRPADAPPTPTSSKSISPIWARQTFLRRPRFLREDILVRRPQGLPSDVPRRPLSSS